MKLIVISRDLLHCVLNSFVVSLGGCVAATWLTTFSVLMPLTNTVGFHRILQQDLCRLDGRHFLLFGSISPEMVGG